MTDDDILRMFHEAGEAAGWKPGAGNALVINYLTHFSALAAAAEREACAQLAAQTVCDTHLPTGIKIYGTAVAKAIRARSRK